MENGILKADGFDEAFLGVAEVHGNVVSVYDRDKAIDILMKRDGMSEESASKFFDFNVQGAYVGEFTPIWVQLCGMKYLEEFV